MKKRKSNYRPGRANKRELKKIDAQLQVFINTFLKIAYYQEEKYDWNAITQLEYERLCGKWKAYCRREKYATHIEELFSLQGLLIKTDLILADKYQLAGDRWLMYAKLQQGMKPLELADFVAENQAEFKVETLKIESDESN